MDFLVAVQTNYCTSSKAETKSVELKRQKLAVSPLRGNQSIAAGFLIDISEAALSTVVPIKVVSHESSGTTLGVGTLFPEPLHLAGIIDLAWCRSSSSSFWRHRGGGALVGESTAVFELFSGEDEALLIGRDAFLVLNLRLDIVDGVGGFNL
ncbi:hypothetical protein V2J09_014561 [Rumex salicifolius]